MWSIIQAAGWPIWPLIFASVVALALIFERLWSLRQSIVAPVGMVDRVLAEYKSEGLTAGAGDENRGAWAVGPRAGGGARQCRKPAAGDEGLI